MLPILKYESYEAGEQLKRPLRSTKVIHIGAI